MTKQHQAVDPLSSFISSKEMNSRSTIVHTKDDLRKLYTPPVKQKVLPSSNPFYNGSMLEYMPSHKKKNDQVKMA
jgi:hypothetical protein